VTIDRFLEKMENKGLIFIRTTQKRNEKASSDLQTTRFQIWVWKF